MKVELRGGAAQKLVDLIATTCDHDDDLHDLRVAMQAKLRTEQHVAILTADELDAVAMLVNDVCRIGSRHPASDDVRPLLVNAHPKLERLAANQRRKEAIDRATQDAAAQDTAGNRRQP